jgi:hypothetical protein
MSFSISCPHHGICCRSKATIQSTISPMELCNKVFNVLSLEFLITLQYRIRSVLSVQSRWRWSQWCHMVFLARLPFSAIASDIAAAEQAVRRQPLQQISRRKYQVLPLRYYDLEASRILEPFLIFYLHISVTYFRSWDSRWGWRHGLLPLRLWTHSKRGSIRRTCCGGKISRYEDVCWVVMARTECTRICESRLGERDRRLHAHYLAVIWQVHPCTHNYFI